MNGVHARFFISARTFRCCCWFEVPVRALRPRSPSFDKSQAIASPGYRIGIVFRCFNSSNFGPNICIFSLARVRPNGPSHEWCKFPDDYAIIYCRATHRVYNGPIVPKIRPLNVDLFSNHSSFSSCSFPFRVILVWHHNRNRVVGFIWGRTLVV